MSPLPPDWVQLGFVTRAHGIQGAVSYHLIHDHGHTLRQGLKIALVSKKIEYYLVERVIPGNRLILEGVRDRTSAEKLAKTEIWVARADFPELEDEEVYLADLIGFEALKPTGESLGKISGFSDNRAQILAEIDGRLLVPFVEPILVEIDEEKRQVVLDFDDEG